MTVHTLFPTFVYTSALQRNGSVELNRQLLREGKQLRKDDTAGRRWSARNYPGGYTSYGSSHKLQRISPTFEALERKLRPHVKAFANTVEWDLEGRELAMTDCWINIMARPATHGLHLHPLSTLSGTYYVRAPVGCAGIKFEDPRLDRFMAAPPRTASARQENRTWITVPAVAGQLVLFESWLRHEVAPNPSTAANPSAANPSAERVSISFNYNWF
jgi:uncharacterized protein (TIGR02466 family)